MAKLTIEARADWGARAPRHGYDPMPSGVKGVKFHYTGGKVDTATLKSHAKCVKAVRDIQNSHMDGNEWNDIGYSFVVCNHGVFTGRGLHHLPAANGPGLNGGHYAVLFLVGNKGVTKLTDAMKTRALDLVAYIRKNGPAGKELKGHRDGYATDCPGPDIYRWVKAGCPRPKAAQPKPEPKPPAPAPAPEPSAPAPAPSAEPPAQQPAPSAPAPGRCS